MHSGVEVRVAGAIARVRHDLSSRAGCLGAGWHACVVVTAGWHPCPEPAAFCQVLGSGTAAT